MKRKIEDYKDQKVAIHCSTKEEWDKIVDLFPLNRRSIKKIYWQANVNNGKSDTINIEGYGWSPKKHFENKGYTIYPASDFLEEKPFKFNIGDEIKAKPGGYYIASPQHFAESHKKQFPSNGTTISGKIIERTQAQGFNWYRCSYDNWITEEGVELVKEDIPEYIEYIDTKYKGQIVKVEEWTNHSFCCIRFENGQREQPFKNLVKPSTKEAFDLQNKLKTISEDIFCIKLNSQEESGTLVFGKYKVGDVVVSLEQKAPYRVVGDMFKVLENNINALYYLHNTCSLASKEWRAATEEEIKAFQQGIKNVNDIPKIGDYVVITKGTNNWSSKMNHYIGKVAKLTSCLSDDKNTFRIDLDNGGWKWQLKHNHFRKAKPDEIPLKQTTMSMQEIQQICKEKYPIGCKYKCLNFNSEYILLQDDCTYTIVNNEIWASHGKGCLYSNGKYAELISLPKSDWNPQIGDHVIIISPTEENNWVSGMDKYVGKLAKITKKREDTSFEIDLDNAYYVWDYKPHRKFFRKAEPHEISTISKSFEFFKEGDKVLIKDGCEYYHQGIDSIGEKMIGIISNVTSSSLLFIVKWSDGSQNTYNKEHLDHYVEMTSSKSISPAMLEIAKSKYPLGTFYIDLYEGKQEVRGTLTIKKDMITDGWGGAVYQKGKWAKIVDALYNDNKSEQKTSTSENYPLTSTKSVTKKKREITLVPLIQPKTVKVFDREENFF